ncbi:peptidyl-prolyl cis-trans isomerase [bacterium]|nr:peptidyl-prolyl cis-trans isomerase [bacterium]
MIMAQDTLETLQNKMGEIVVVEIETSLGTIEVALFKDKAPITVSNFLQYAEEKYYDGTIFHNVIDDFMIQGGGLTLDLKQKETHNPIKNEAANGLKNTMGTIAMARTGVVDSATSQFFINLQDNDFLNHKNATASDYGYAVFGKVINGMDVVEKIKSVKTGNKLQDPDMKRNLFQDVPIETVLIKSIRIK